MRRDLALAGATFGLVAAALVPLHRVFTSSAWVPNVVLALVVALVVAAAGRASRLPAVVTLPLTLTALTVTALRLHAPEHGPWPSAAAFDELWRGLKVAGTVARDDPAPVEASPELLLLLLVATWLVTHATHETMVRLRRPGTGVLIAGLLWFVPLAVPVPSTVAWPNALPFLFVVGLALLLEPDPDLAGWTREDTAPVLPAGGVLVAGAAAVFGLLAPWLTLGYDQPSWVDVSTGTEPRGYQPIVDVTNRLQLPEPYDVLEVRSSQQAYLRIAGLDTYDGRAWRLGPPGVDTFRPEPDELFRATGPLPFEVPIAEGTALDVDVEVLSLGNIYLPVPYQVHALEGPPGTTMFYSRQGGFVATGDLEDTTEQGGPTVAVRAGFAYNAQSIVPTPTYDALASQGDITLPTGHALVALPDGYDDIADLTRGIIEDAAATTSIDAALAVQDWFIGPASTFTYSLDIPEPRGVEALRDFLFDTQVGYCEHFATAMAVMLRSIGIPARVAVGFLPGEVVRPAVEPGQPATFRVSTTDAHAWVEILFDGHGWVRMDPTPRADGLPASADDLLPLPPATAPQATEPAEAEPPTTEPRDPTETNLLPTDDQTDVPDPSTGELPEGLPLRTPLTVLVVLVLLLIVMALGVHLRPALRHRWIRVQPDPTLEVLAAQRRVLLTAAEYGEGRSPAETVTEAAVRWAHAGIVSPEDAILFSRLGGQAAFGVGLAGDDATAMRELEQRMVAGFVTTIDRSQRLAGPWQHAGTRLMATLTSRRGPTS